MIENAELIGGLLATNVALVGAVVYVIKNYLKGKPSNGSCAAPADVDDVHERINKRVEDCSTLRESCRKEINEHLTEILQRLSRIEASLNGKSKPN